MFVLILYMFQANRLGGFVCNFDVLQTYSLVAYASEIYGPCENELQSYTP